MNTIGFDIGLTAGGIIVWTVFADTNRYVGMLAGKYVGVTAEVSFAAGLGANVLIGDSHRTVALQPLSAQGQVGIDLAPASARAWRFDGQSSSRGLDVRGSMIFPKPGRYFS